MIRKNINKKADPNHDRLPRGTESLGKYKYTLQGERCTSCFENTEQNYFGVGIEPTYHNKLKLQCDGLSTPQRM